jgi:uncharacterized protein
VSGKPAPSEVLNMTSNPSKFISHLLTLVACVLVATVGISCTSEGETKALIAKAEQGDAEAQSLLGYMYINGEGVLKDYKEAVKWIRKAAEQGYAEAQSNLGVMYANGRGVSQDYKEAVKWFRKAAEQGYARAQYNLGVRYANGLGVIKDDKEAVKWYRKAAEQGVADAQLNLGVMYSTGQGVPQDYVRAYAWGNVGSANGSDNGSELRDNVARALTPEQIAVAQKLSKVWFEKYQPKE